MAKAKRLKKVSESEIRNPERFAMIEILMGYFESESKQAGEMKAYRKIKKAIQAFFHLNVPRPLLRRMVKGGAAVRVTFRKGSSKEGQVEFAVGPFDGVRSYAAFLNTEKAA